MQEMASPDASINWKNNLAILAPWREKKGWTSIEQASGTSYTEGRSLFPARGIRGQGTSFPVLYRLYNHCWIHK